jgi:hypothetical protein
MATDKNFIVKNGLEVGGQEVISSSGVVTSAALGGQTLSSTDSPTFNDLTLTGDLNLSGELNITGDINSLSVTDLDVADKTITLGAGQVESASGGSGIIVDGAGASILWDETNDEFDINKDINITGTITASGNITVSGDAYANTYRKNGDSDTYLNFPAANQLSLVGGGSEIVRAYQIAGAYGVLKVYGSGSATYPNFTFNGDDNTGMYRATTDTLAFTTGGSEAMRIDSSGIDVTGTVTADGLTVEGSSTGTITPVNILNTDSSSNQTATRLGLGITNTSGANYTYIEAKEIGVDSFAEMNFYTGVTDTKRMTLGTYGDISFYEDTGTTAKLFWDASAESLGIGTDSPDSKLTVNTATAGDGIELQSNETSIAKLSRTTVGSTVVASLDGVAGRPIHIGGVVNEKVILANAGGNVGIGTTNQIGEKLTVNGSVQVLGNNDPNYSAKFISAYDSTHGLRITTRLNDVTESEVLGVFADSGGASPRLALNPTNGWKVGIGTTDPQEKLQINGNLRMFSAGYPLIDIGITTSNYFRFVHDNPNDIFKIGKNGAATLNIGGSGNVGIGEINPDYQLHVSGAGDIKIEDTGGGSAHLHIGASTGGLRNSEWRLKTSGNNDEFTFDHRYTANDGSNDVVDGSTVLALTTDNNVDVANDLLTNNAKLKAIAESNTDTAVDVFVYDTRKDSDGGAWRKRTQHTSWYNETLNTSTRGSRKEFPCVAVIVVEAAQVTIYDGDDPDMPMWMVFNGLNAGSSYTWHGSGYSGEDNTCASMKNGVLCIGVSGNVGTVSGLSTVSFIDEFFIKYGGARGDIQRPIVFRNSSFIVNYQGSMYDLAGDNISDVTMTVLPNAPINSGTGLPVPTIAISTSGGVSVIKDNGSIVDITSANGWVFSGFLTFDEENYIIAHVGNATGQGLVFRYPIPAGNITVSSGDSNLIAGGNIYNGNFSPTLGNSLGQLNKIAADESGVSLNGKNNGTSNLVKYYRNYDVYSKSSVAYINSAYNTGWMQGDIRLATLSSTSTVDNTDYIGGAGTFANAGDWSTDSQWSVSGGTASYSGSGPAYISRAPTSNFVYGNWYYAELDVTAGSAGSLLLVNRHINGVLKPHTSGLTNVDVGFIQLSGTKYYAMWKQNANNQGSISLYATAAVTVDNFKVYEMPAHDRSVNNNHFIKYGTINSSAVATGAELISYSTTGSIGNGNSDYLFQPYTADLDFGTGDLSTIIWYRQDSSLSDWSQMFQRGGEQYLTLRTHPSSNATYNGKILFKVGSASWAITDYNTIGQGWICIVLTRQSGITRMYVNGNLEYTTATHTGTVNSGEGLSINPGGGKVALLRMSATVPSQEQIKKIYNDEKHLFAENAKATLYGSSDDIAALAYDDDTELLHVGTSAGRSVFQGLNRVDNTTDAVGTAISASSELVVEE